MAKRPIQSIYGKFAVGPRTYDRSIINFGKNLLLDESKVVKKVDNMIDQELERLFARISTEANLAIDRLIIIRQASQNGRKQKLSYLTKKLEVIVGACNKSLDKLSASV